VTPTNPPSPTALLLPLSHAHAKDLRAYALSNVRQFAEITRFRGQCPISAFGQVPRWPETAFEEMRAQTILAETSLPTSGLLDLSAAIPMHQLRRVRSLGGSSKSRRRRVCRIAQRGLNTCATVIESSTVLEIEIIYLAKPRSHSASRSHIRFGQQGSSNTQGVLR